MEETSAEDEQADNNWFLSRSAPNSLNNGLNSQNLKLSTSKSHDSGQHQTPPSSDQVWVDTIVLSLTLYVFTKLGFTLGRRKTTSSDAQHHETSTSFLLSGIRRTRYVPASI